MGRGVLPASCAGMWTGHHQLPLQMPLPRWREMENAHPSDSSLRIPCQYGVSEDGHRTRQQGHPPEISWGTGTGLLIAPS